jgi:hypothetical protein
MEYSVPDLRRAVDYPSKQIPELVVGRFGLPLSTANHSTQQRREDLDYAEYEEGTSPNVFLRTFEKVIRANGVAHDLQLITIFSLYLPNKVLLWHDYYLNDHPDCSWVELKIAYYKRYGGEPWQQGCQKRTSYGKNYRPDVRLRPRLPCGRIFTVRRSGKNRVRAEAPMCPRGRVNASVQTWASARKPICADISTSARTRLCVRADIGPSAQTRSSLCPRPPFVTPRSPCADGLLHSHGRSPSTRMGEKNKNLIIFYF